MGEQDRIAHRQNGQRTLGRFVGGELGRDRIAHYSSLEYLSLSVFHSTLDELNWQKDANCRARLLNSKPSFAFCKAWNASGLTPVTWHPAGLRLRVLKGSQARFKSAALSSRFPS